MIVRWTPWKVEPSGLATRSRGADGLNLVGRFAAPARHRALWMSLAAAAVLTGEIAALVPTVFGDDPVPGYRVAFRLVGGVFGACGLIAWRRRPDSLSGPLMIATGLGLLVEPVFDQFEPSAIRTVGDLLEDAWAIPAIALILTFVTGGRLVTRVDRVLVGVFVAASVLEFVRHLFLVREGNFLFVHPSAALADGLLELSSALVAVGCIAVAVVTAARWKAAPAPRRRALLPSVAGIGCLLFFAIVQFADTLVVAWLAVGSLLAIPLAFLAGLLRSRLARGDLAQLFRDLPTLHGPALEGRLAKAMGDPGLMLAYAGDGVELPAPGSGRATAPIQRDGHQVAVLVYDAALDDDPDLVEAVRSAATIALETEHLHAESKEQLGELRASRQRLVAAGDAERRRLERDLHDGAQQRLVALAIQLRLIQNDIRRNPAAAEQLVTSASQELAESLQELRELARGIHPAALDQGLEPALESLAARSTVATALAYDAPGRLPRPVELAAYFVACESLANVAKYSGATAASVDLRRTATGVRIEIADDGIGGADPARGSGLRGLADRVEALDGRLRATSPRGEGTVVTAELPCGWCE